MNQMREKTVKVEKVDLLSKLKENKKKHVEEYNQALLDYKKLSLHKLDILKKEALEEIDKNYDIVVDQINEFDPENPTNDRIFVVQNVYFDLKVPKSFEDQYDLAIEMYTWEVEPTVELTVVEFRQFVLDKWDWQDSFKNLTKFYSVATSGLCNG